MSDRQRIGGIDIGDGTPTPVCRWCHETKGQHLPPSQPNRMRARMPCLGWQEHFVPDSSAPAPSEGSPALSTRQAQVLRGVLDWLKTGLTRCFAIEHTMFHGAFAVNFDGQEPQQAFAFLVIGTETAARARELLAPLPLCTTDLGPVPHRRCSPEEATPSSMGDAPTLKVGETHLTQALDVLRVAFAKELWARHFELGNAHMDQTLHTYEREAKERIG